MATKSLNLLLMLLVLGCPVWCSPEACGAAVAGSAVAGGHQAGCCKKNAPESRQDGTPPAPHDEETPGTCQCFCGGALVEHRAIDVTERSLTPHAISHASNGIVLESVLAREGRLPIPFPSDGTNSSGRLLCILHMSLLI